MLRRRALLACAAGGLLTACANAPRAGVARELAPGVWVVPGTGGAADPANLGRIGNAGFVVGPQGVVAVDTGTSYAHGQALLATIRAVTDRPVRVAVVTHTRPEFLFGGGAFRDAGIPVRMHRRTATLMASRCETCLKTLRQVVGEAPLAGTAMYKPDQQYDDSHDLGELIGRPLRVQYFGHSSGPGDVAVFEPSAGVLFAGGLLDVHRVPDIQDSDLPGWRHALAELHTMDVRTVVPGHGAPASAGGIDAVERYLAALETKVRAIVAEGASLLGVADAAELPEYESWDQYDVIHRRNASVAFLRFERELMFKTGNT
ncbi:MAG: MBL fold metallo-hydrolase [Rubrivivax sp.]